MESDKSQKVFDVTFNVKEEMGDGHNEKAVLNRGDGGYPPYPNKRKYRLEKYEKLNIDPATISNQFTGKQVRSSNSLCSKYFLKKNLSFF